MQRHLVYILFFSFCAIPLIHASSFSIVPKPQQIELNNETFQLTSDCIVKTHLPNKDAAELIVGQLYNEVKKQAGIELGLATPGEKIIHLGIMDKNSEFLTICREAQIQPNEKIGQQGYILLIKPKKIIAAANTKQGLFYAVQSLKQLIRGSKAPGQIPCLKITDWPDLEYRGMQDDISRGPVPTLDFMKAQVRRCAEMKLNLLSYYTEHVVRTEKHGDFAPTKGSISIAEWRELSEYAKDYFVLLKGNFQSLGHFEKIMAFPQYRAMGETDRMISPIDPQAAQFLEDVYNEMVPVFSAPWFNANCDETWDLGRGPSKPRVDSLGVGRVYADHIKRLAEVVRRHNKRLMIWGDIVLEHPHVFEMLPKDIVMGAWDYSPYESFDHLLKPFQDAGFDFMFSCGVLNSNRMMPDYRMTFTNIRNFNRDAKKYGAIGMLNTVWDDGGSALFGLDWYGVAYAADQSWCGNTDSREIFNSRFDRAVYGIREGSISGAYTQMIGLTDLPATQEMNEYIYWEKLLPERMRSLEINTGATENILAICDSARSQLANLKMTDYKQDLEYAHFIIDQYSYIGLSRQKMVAAAKAYQKACMIQKQNRAESRELLNSTLKNLTWIAGETERLRDMFSRLWNMENQAYWLDHITEQYTGRSSTFRKTEEYLNKAIRDFDDGLYLPPPNKIRLAVTETKGQYFQYWLLLGPFPNVRWQGRETDYLVSMGGESAARPKPGSVTSGPDGSQMYWQKYTSPVQNKIELDQIYHNNQEVVVYAYCRISSADKRRVRATLGSNDGIQVFLNGTKEYVNYQKRSLIPDEDEVYLDLNQGTNHLLLKIDQNKGGWGFSFRLPDVTIRNHKYKYRIVTAESKD